MFFHFILFYKKILYLEIVAQWIPTLKGHALPGGIVTREAYESLVGKTLTMLDENLPYDGLFFDIHGAMSVGWS